MFKVKYNWAYGKAGNEYGNGNRNGKLKWNSCMVVFNHWTGLTQLPLLRAYGKAGNGNGNRNGNRNEKLKWNSCTVVSNHWTGLTQSISFSVGQKLKLAYSAYCT